MDKPTQTTRRKPKSLAESIQMKDDDFRNRVLDEAIDWLNNHGFDGDAVMGIGSLKRNMS